MQYTKLSAAERESLMASLAGMKNYLRQAFRSLSAEEALIPGPGGAFCPVEQVWHLADLEREGFGSRIERLRTELNPRLPDFDGTRIAHERNYRSLSLEAGLKAFEVARDANLAALLAVQAGDWTRRGTQDGVGEVMLCDMPVFLQQHDHAHIAEIEQWKQQFGR
jgi:DinB family protein